MARLTAAQRNALPDSAFAGPNRSYPIPDSSHRKAALSMVSRYGTPALKARVRAKAAGRSSSGLRALAERRAR